MKNTYLPRYKGIHTFRAVVCCDIWLWNCFYYTINTSNVCIMWPSISLLSLDHALLHSMHYLEAIKWFINFSLQTSVKFTSSTSLKSFRTHYSIGLKLYWEMSQFRGDNKKSIAYIRIHLSERLESTRDKTLTCCRQYKQLIMKYTKFYLVLMSCNIDPM